MKSIPNEVIEELCPVSSPSADKSMRDDDKDDKSCLNTKLDFVVEKFEYLRLTLNKYEKSKKSELF